MNRLELKRTRLASRRNRVKAVLKNASNRPRLSVLITNKHVSAQIVDDETGKTLVASSTVKQEKLPTNLTERAKWVGEDIATKAKAKKIKQVAYDRNGRLYHGRIKALADAAREKGLEF